MIGDINIPLECRRAEYQMCALWYNVTSVMVRILVYIVTYVSEDRAQRLSPINEWSIWRKLAYHPHTKFSFSRGPTRFFFLPSISECCLCLDNRTQAPDSRNARVWCSHGISGYFHVSWPCSKPLLLVVMPKIYNRWVTRWIIQELPDNHLYSCRIPFRYFEHQLIGVIDESWTRVARRKESETHSFLSH